MSERFFRSSRAGNPQPVCSELENSGIRVVVGDCSVTERRRRGPPYQTGKTVHAKTLPTQRGRTQALGVRGIGSVPLSHSGTSLRELDNNNVYLSQYREITTYLLDVKENRCAPLSYSYACGSWTLTA